MYSSVLVRLKSVCLSVFGLPVCWSVWRLYFFCYINICTIRYLVWCRSDETHPAVLLLGWDQFLLLLAFLSLNMKKNFGAGTGCRLIRCGQKKYRTVVDNSKSVCLSLVCLSLFCRSVCLWIFCLSGVCVFVLYLCMFVVRCRSDRAPQAVPLFK
jgi:hypothetical protein